MDNFLNVTENICVLGLISAVRGCEANLVTIKTSCIAVDYSSDANFCA